MMEVFADWPITTAMAALFALYMVAGRWAEWRQRRRQTKEG